MRMVRERTPTERGKAVKFKPFKAWLLWDADGTYVPTLWLQRISARREKEQHVYRDAKWRITRVSVISPSTEGKR